MSIFKKLYIFDIDGCILPSIFPKLLKDDQSEEEKQKIIDYVNKKGLKTKLYPNFVKFFEMYCYNRCNTIVWFITGRKESYAKKLTMFQLRNLHCNFGLKFYPEDGEYTQEYYTKWKLNTILDLLKENMYEYDKCFVFDDDSSYFISLLSKCSICFVYEINTDKMWKDLRLI